MSTIDAASFFSSDRPPVPVRRFSVDEYHRLGELGILTADDRVELLEGWIVEKMNQKPAHGYVVAELDGWFQRNISAEYVVRCQLPITTAKSEPEPDLAVIRGSHRQFRRRHPSGTECHLVVEVADSSVDRDRAKASIYASAGVEEYWIVNLVDRQLERFQLASENGYERCLEIPFAEEVKIEVGKKSINVRLAHVFQLDE